MSILTPKHGPKDNSRKKGAEIEAKARRRKEAEERQKTHDALPFDVKLSLAGAKEKAKLLKKQQQNKKEK